MPTGGAKIRVLLVDDHTIVREGLRLLLDASPDIEVVAEAGDGLAAIAAAERNRPEVVVIDLALPGLDGVEVARRISGGTRTPRVLVLSMHGSPEHVRAAIRAGVSGYLVKGSGIADLLDAIRAVARGETFFPRSVDPSSGAPTLTPREREVLRLVAEGLSTTEIAEELALSVKTVEGHRSRLMEKLDAPNAAALARHAVRLGIVAIE